MGWPQARRAGQGGCPGCPGKWEEEWPSELARHESPRIPRSTPNCFKVDGISEALGEGGQVLGPLARAPGFKLDACDISAGVSPICPEGLGCPLSCPQAVSSPVLEEASSCCLHFASWSLGPFLSILPLEYKVPNLPATSRVNAWLQPPPSATWLHAQPPKPGPASAPPCCPTSVTPAGLLPHCFPKSLCSPATPNIFSISF